MPTRQGGNLPNQASTWARRSERRTTIAPCRSTPCTWNTVLARSRPIVLTSPMDGSRPLVATTQLWHTDAVRGPSTPSWPDFDPAISGRTVGVDGPRTASVCAKMRSLQISTKGAVRGPDYSHWHGYVEANLSAAWGGPLRARGSAQEASAQGGSGAFCCPGTDGCWDRGVWRLAFLGRRADPGL